MITKPTVFILGAGASTPYGFPQGKELFWEVISNALRKEGAEFLSKIGYSKEEIEQFRNALFGSGRESVDAFLEHRREFIDIGKAAMAYILVAKEKEHILYEEGTGRWYKFLYDKLNTSFDKFGNNRVSFIIYNYDRSLEHFLYNSLKTSYNKPDEECAEELRKIRIIHLHGRLGRLPWQLVPGAERTYHPHTEPNIIKESAQEIKIIHERTNVDEDIEFRQASGLLGQAERVYFLGFGYNRINLKRLNVNSWVTANIVGGSTYGFVENEVAEISDAFGVSVELDDKHSDVLMFLRRRVEWS